MANKNQLKKSNRKGSSLFVKNGTSFLHLILMHQRKKNKENEEHLNLVNVQILDSILEDNDEKFFQLISLNTESNNYNKPFSLTNYKMPNILSNNPTYSSLCAAFGAEKCFNSLLSLYPEGIHCKSFNETDKQGREPIHFACFNGNLNILRLYYQENYDFTVKDFQGRAPCHYAAMSSSIDAIKYLWTKGINILTQTDKKSLTPVQIACLYGNVEIVKFLCETVADGNNKILGLNGSYRNRDCENETSLHLACQSGNIEIVNYILSKKKMAENLIKALDTKKRTPLHCAIQSGSFECVKALITIGNAQISNKGRRHIALIDASAHGYIDIVSFLLKQKNIDTKVANSKKITALDAAILNDHLNVVKLLIENGAASDLNEEGIGRIFLQACGIKNIEMIKYLDNALNIPYQIKGDSFMKQAILIEWEELVCFLLEKKCTFNKIHNYISFRGKWTPFMSFLKEKGADFLGIPEREYAHPLITKAIESGNLKSVKKFIEEGTELTKEMISKYRCLVYAARKMKLDLFNFLLSYQPELEYPGEVIIELIDKYIDSRNKSKKSKMDDCLQMARIFIKQCKVDLNNYKIVSKIVYACSIEFLEFLVENSVDFNQFPLNYSKMVSSEFMPVFIFLENHGCKFEKTTIDCNVYYSYNFKYNSYEIDPKKFYDYSPVYMNLTMSGNYYYDVNTLIFLIKYAKYVDLKNAIYYNRNVIDILTYFKCYDAILKVYIKLDEVMIPRTLTKDDYMKLILNSSNQELITFIYDHQ